MRAAVDAAEAGGGTASIEVEGQHPRLWPEQHPDGMDVGVAGQGGDRLEVEAAAAPGQ